ncbi:GTP pyrophosphokinase family protein [Pradoshia sp. D12]|nr:GTP pyrophosphokinase family protein [Pradoshia sp. D12]TPF73818.1 GTP pyrophosphokinase family protein [Bacillus sp. D12]
MNTKLEILNQEFELIHNYNPIEHIKSRMKSPQSIMKKLKRKNLDITVENAQQNVRDIAGIRISCSFTTDIYAIVDALGKQDDIHIIEIKDYIKNPKSNGYRSLHLITEIPVFFSNCKKWMPVEIQIRTIAMDFWASLEHKIYYKFSKDVPEHLLQELKGSADMIAELDDKMLRINEEVQIYKDIDKLMSETKL